VGSLSSTPTAGNNHAGFTVNDVHELKVIPGEGIFSAIKP
jgi:hypothetical protein